MSVLCSGEEGEQEATGDHTRITVVLTCVSVLCSGPEGEEGEREAAGDDTTAADEEQEPATGAGGDGGPAG